MAIFILRIKKKFFKYITLFELNEKEYFFTTIKLTIDTKNIINSILIYQPCENYAAEHAEIALTTRICDGSNINVAEDRLACDF